MNGKKVAIVVLRRPNKNVPGEMRTDPLWEFGSFGCTGCHSRNLMNLKKAFELEGVKLAFAQGGQLGFRLVHITPPVCIVYHSRFVEAKWHPIEFIHNKA